MPITCSFDATKGRLLAVATGPIKLDDVLEHLDEEQASGGLRRHELIDATQATAGLLTAKDIREIVDRLRRLAETNPLGPTAVLVADDVSYGVLRMLQILVEEICDIQPFRSRTEAEAWLDSVRSPRLPSTSS